MHDYPDRDMLSRLHTPASYACAWLQQALRPTQEGGIHLRWVTVMVGHEPLSARDERRLRGLLGRPFRGDVGAYRDGFTWKAKRPSQDDVDNLLNAVGFVAPRVINFTPLEVVHEGVTWQDLPTLVWEPRSEGSIREYWRYVVEVAAYRRA